MFSHESSQDQENTKIVTLPCIKGTMDKIAKILKKGNIRVVVAPQKTIKSLLDYAKDPIDPNLRKGVYTIPCSCGKYYIRKTGRSLQARVKEHCTDIKHGWVKRLALAEHSQDSGSLAISFALTDRKSLLTLITTLKKSP